MIKRLIASALVCAISLAVTLGAVSAAAEPAIAANIPYIAAAAAVSSDQDVLTQLKAEVMPQLEAILTPEQLEMFEAEISGGTSFRKTFKSLMLNPEQKTDIKALLKSMPKKDTFASLTPMQKKKLFLEKKEAFMPTSDEIMDKINAKMEGGGEGTLPEGVRGKIDAGLKARDTYMPSNDSIVDKIEAGINSVKESFSGE